MLNLSNVLNLSNELKVLNVQDVWAALSEICGTDRLLPARLHVCDR